MEPKQQIAIMRELTIQTFTIDLLQCQKRIKLCNAMKLICGVVQKCIILMNYHNVQGKICK